MKNNYVSAAAALQLIGSGQRIFLHGSAATPSFLIHALAQNSSHLKNVEVTAVSTFGPMPIAGPEFKDRFYFNSLFVSENVRACINSDNGEYIPIFLSEIASLFERGILPIDVALIHVSPPDQHGFCSLGLSVDVALSAVKHAKKIIAQVNPNMPRTHGDGFIHVSRIDAMVECTDPLPQVRYGDRISESERAIGKEIAALVEDRSTLQLGIGGIPDAALQALTGSKDLGIHTEMFSDGVIDLITKGVITNAYKKLYPGKTVAAFAAGTDKLYHFVNDNPSFSFQEASHVNDPHTIRQNPKVVAINSAIEIDITGQVCADSIGTHQFSGVGGQMDFIRGAALSEGGKPIIALSSITKKGDSKIVPFLKPGAGVVTTRAHMHYIVTEFGVADLFGKNLHQRALALLKIAHPDHHDTLEKEIIKRFGSWTFPVS
jgi:acyl-CoA hydrolase